MLKPNVSCLLSIYSRLIAIYKYNLKRQNDAVTAHPADILYFPTLRHNSFININHDTSA